jgi:hypothetical protein
MFIIITPTPTSTHKHTNTRRTDTSIINKHTKRTSYFENGTIKYEYWVKDGFFHRLNAPAYISYYENGTIKYEEWCKNGKPHRLNMFLRSFHIMKMELFRLKSGVKMD